MELQIKTKRRKLTTADQYNRLVEFMVENPQLPSYISVKTAEDRLAYNTSWENLSTELNMRGPPMRTMEQWKKVWEAYRYRITKCHMKQKIEQNRATEGPANYKKVNFSNNELAIINILNLEAAPMSSRKKIAHSTPTITKPTTIVQEQFESTIVKTEQSEMVFEITDVTDEMEFIETNSPPTSPTNPDSTNILSEDKREIDLFEEQVEIEKQIRTIKMEKVNILRQIAEIKQRHLELKEKMHDLKERKFEMKCQQFKDDHKYKTQKLELKKRELDLKAAAKLRKEKKLLREN